MSDRTTIRVSIPETPRRAGAGPPADPLARAWLRTTSGLEREAWVAATIERQRGRTLEQVLVVAHARRLNATTVAFTIVHHRALTPKTPKQRLLHAIDPPHRWRRRTLRHARRSRRADA